MDTSLVISYVLQLIIVLGFLSGNDWPKQYRYYFWSFLYLLIPWGFWISLFVLFIFVIGLIIYTVFKKIYMFFVGAHKYIDFLKEMKW